MKRFEINAAGGKSFLRLVITNNQIKKKLKRKANLSPERLRLYRDTLDAYERARALYAECKNSLIPGRAKRVKALLKTAEDNLRAAWRMMLQ